MKKLLIICFFTSFLACKKEYLPENKIHEDVTFLADDKLEGRQTGTDGEKAAADYLAKRFKDLNLEPKGTTGYFQDFTFRPKTGPHQEVKYTSSNTDSTITGRNILAFLNNNANQTVIIGAHYDHLGYGEEGSLYRGEGKEIHNGADDNASGVAVMLNLASKLKNNNKENNYLFLAFSG